MEDIGSITGTMYATNLNLFHQMVGLPSTIILILTICIVLVQCFFSKNKTTSEIIFRWVAFFCLGLENLLIGFLHIFRPFVMSGEYLTDISPLQYELGIAFISIGVLGIFSFNASYIFRKTTTIASTIFLWGIAFGFIYHMMLESNLAKMNVHLLKEIERIGPWLWLDILVPFILIVCLIRIKKNNSSRY